MKRRCGVVDSSWAICWLQVGKTVEKMWAWVIRGVRVTPFASTELALKHTRNKLYKELVLQHLVLQLFDDSRKGSTRFVSTGIRSTKI